jgi:hypothetical protein
MSIEFSEKEKIVFYHWRSGSKLSQYLEDLPGMSEADVLITLRHVMGEFFRRDS